MLYQLPDGTTIRIPDELFCTLDDVEFNRMILHRKGSEINDPFHDSVLRRGSLKCTDAEDEEDLPACTMPEGYDDFLD